MDPTRRTVLAALLLGATLVAAVILAGVLGTVFFAITVVYVLEAPYDWFRRLGLSRWWSSALTTLGAFVAVIGLFVPFGVILYLRRAALIDLLRGLPDSVVVEAGGFAYAVETAEVTATAARALTRLALGLARSAPALAAKATVFAFVVFALLLRRSQLRRALLDPVPETYRDIPLALNDRARRTLRALYVVQAATALGTFLVALPVFWILGYSFPVTLAVLAGVLQFIPVIGPSLLVIGLAGFEASLGAFDRAAIVLLVGLVLIAFVPDAVIRPRLAREAAQLPASLYFVGFTGGVFSLGAVGIIAGPLAVALLIEVFWLFASDVAEAGATG